MSAIEKHVRVTDEFGMYFRVYFYEVRGEKIFAARLSSEEQELARDSIYPPDATHQLPKPVAQELFNELWKLGFRPAGGEDSVAHVQSLKNHIADLRHVVFKTKP